MHYIGYIIGKDGNYNFMKLSVALCTYNGAPYIEKQLLSIYKQEVPIDEIVICDDNSNDNTISIICSFLHRHKFRHTIIERNKKRLGVIKNFEKAISLCSGDIIFLSDQDDIWLPEKTRKIITYFNHNNDINFCFSDAFLINDNDEIKSKWSLFDAVGFRDSIKTAWDLGYTFEITNIFDNKATGATVAFRSLWVDKVIPFHTNIHQLHDSQLAIASIIDNSIGYLPQKLTLYRIHSTQTCGLNDNWVFTSQKKHNDFPSLLEPIPIKEFWFRFKRNSEFNNRLFFYKKRTYLYRSITGKLLLVISLPCYIRYYHRFWYKFYWNDVTYGIISKIKKIVSIR